MTIIYDGVRRQGRYLEVFNHNSEDVCLINPIQITCVESSCPVTLIHLSDGVTIKIAQDYEQIRHKLVVQL